MADDAPPTETQKTDEKRWADLVDLALIISREIQHHGPSDPRAASLTKREGVVMRHLLRGDPATPSQIAAATGLLRPNVSAALRTLQSKGLIEKQADSTDGHGFTIRPTTLGRANNKLVRHEWATAVAKAADHDTADLDAAIALLTKVKEGLRLICRARDRDEAEQRPYRWLVRCSDAAGPELTRLARTMDVLREALLAHFDTGGLSNGSREAMNC